MECAIKKSMPVLCSYVFVSMAYGMMMETAGFAWYWSLAASLSIYTGAFQMVLVSFMSSKVSFAAVAVTALLMNSRQFFYGLTFLEDFKKMGRRYPYMIHTMTDETYAINCALLAEKEEFEHEEGRREVMFYTALFCRLSWMLGAVLGGVLGQFLPVRLEGIDFCMTAMFTVIFIDQWRRATHHAPALAGLCFGLLCLFVFGQERFMLPALLLVSGMLLFMKNFTSKGEDRC